MAFLMDPIPASLSAWKRLPGAYRLRARNYAPRSQNAIHRDDFAKQFGFTGGLVPGVGVYALMTHPFALVLGEGWLDAGWMRAKFIHPVYDGEEVEVRCTPDPSLGDWRMAIEVRDPRGVLCAIGSGGMGSDDENRPDPADYEPRPMPSAEARRRPESADLPPGAALGSMPVQSDPGVEEDAYFEQLRDGLAIFREGSGRFHPAFLPHLANRMVHRNIAVGPWIHTESRVVHFAAARPGDELEMRGRIRESFNKRAHEYVALDLAVFDPRGAPIARLDHTAIVQPHLKAVSE